MLLTNLASSAHEEMWVTYQVNRVPSDAAKCVEVLSTTTLAFII